MPPLGKAPEAGSAVKAGVRHGGAELHPRLATPPTNLLEREPPRLPGYPGLFLRTPLDKARGGAGDAPETRTIDMPRALNGSRNVLAAPIAVTLDNRQARPAVLPLGLLESTGFPRSGAIPTMAPERQIARKLHGVGEPGGRRAHGLIDLQPIAVHSKIDLALAGRTCERPFAYRRRRAWPPVTSVDDDWGGPYQARLLSPPVKQTVQEAVARANGFIESIARSRWHGAKMAGPASLPFSKSA